MGFGRGLLATKEKVLGNPQGRKNDRIEALTTYQIIRSNQYFTMVSLILGTGRQHQIRKLAALAKHAVVGDTRYGERRYNTMIAKRYQMNDLCLCASKLEIKVDGIQYRFDVNVPTDGQHWFKILMDEAKSVTENYIEHMRT